MAKRTRKFYSRHFYSDSIAEDYEMGRVLSNQAFFVDTRDENGEITFVPVVMENLMVEKIPPNLWLQDFSFFKNLRYGGLKCCSDVCIAFHYTQPASMHFLEYLIYNVHPYGSAHNETEVLPRKLTLQKILDAADPEIPVDN